MLTRSEARFKTMTILYQISLYNKNKILYEVEDIIKDQLDKENKFINSLVYGVLENISDIDEVANKYLDSWNIDRLGLTDQAILRIGIFELIYTTTPDKVCIDEAIELSKKYSDEKVSKMINGVLDKIYHSKENHE